MAAMSHAEYQAALQKYLDLKKKGVPAMDALKQAFPNGLPTKEDKMKAEQKKAAGQQQSALLTALAGTAAAGLTVQQINSYIESSGGIKSVLGLGEGATTTTTAATPTAGTTATTGQQVASLGTDAGPVVQQGGTAAAGGTPMFDIGGPSYAGYLGAGKDAYDLYHDWDSIPDEEKASRAQQQAALGAADVFTGGLTGLAVGAVKKTGPGKKIDEWATNLDRRTNPLSIALSKSLFHKSTKDYQKENWGRLVEEGKVTPEQAQSWLGSDRKEDRSGQQIFEQAKQDGKQIWGTSGFFDTFGKDWLGGKFNENQRAEIAKRVAQEGIIESSKGDWFITNQERARQIGDEVLGAQAQPQASPLLSAMQGGPARAEPLQTQPGQLPTLAGALTQRQHSPGFDDKTGRRIFYR